jgi:cyclohexanone monooxygenase
VNLIRTSPKNIAQVAFFQQCTPGYYNAEGKAKKSEDIFLGGRYGDGPMPFYAMLESWRADDRLDGMILEPQRPHGLDEMSDPGRERSAIRQGV